MSTELKKPMSEKTPEMRRAIEKLLPGTLQAIEEHKCPVCKGPAEEFRNAVSKREYEVSGMCQKCQDSVFGAD